MFFASLVDDLLDLVGSFVPAFPAALEEVVPLIDVVHGCVIAGPGDVMVVVVFTSL